MPYIDLEPINQLYKRIERIRDNDIWFFSVDDDVREEIIRLNTIEQLYEQGIDSLGRQLGDYSPFTVQIKQMKGQRFDHITLNDTGAFYDSWVVTVATDSIDIDADDTSLYDRPLFAVWGEDVAGLTDENLQYIIDMIKENYIKYLVNELLR